MSAKELRFPEEQVPEEREFDPSQLNERSEAPEFGSPSVVEEDGPLVRGESIQEEVLEKLKQRNRTKAIRQRIQEQYSGQGIVAVEKSSEEVIAIADSMHGMLGELRESDVDSEETLLVRCHEYQ